MALTYKQIREIAVNQDHIAAVAFSATATTDAAILTAVKSVWNHYAGVG